MPKAKLSDVGEQADPNDGIAGHSDEPLKARDGRGRLARPLEHVGLELQRGGAPGINRQGLNDEVHPPAQLTEPVDGHSRDLGQPLSLRHRRLEGVRCRGPKGDQRLPTTGTPMGAGEQIEHCGIIGGGGAGDLEQLHGAFVERVFGEPRRGCVDEQSELKLAVSTLTRLALQAVGQATYVPVGRRELRQRPGRSAITRREVERRRVTRLCRRSVVAPRVDIALRDEEGGALKGRVLGAQLRIEQAEHPRPPPGPREDRPPRVKNRQVEWVATVGPLVGRDRTPIITQARLVDSTDLVGEDRATAGINGGRDVALVGVQQIDDPVPLGVAEV